MKMRFSRIAGMLLAMLFLIGVTAWAASQHVNDGGKFFSDSTISELISRIERIKNATGKDIYVLTVDKLEGKTIDEAAVSYGKSHNVNGVVIYISRQPAKVAVKVGVNTAKLITEDKKAIIRNTMVYSFKQKRFDDGVLQAVGMLEEYMNSHVGGVTTPPSSHVKPETALAPKKENKGTNWFLLLIVIGGLFLVITMIMRAITGSQGQRGQDGMAQTPGAPTTGMPGGGGFLSGLMGGLGGALLGNWLFNSFSGHGDQHNESMAAGNMGGDSFGGGSPGSSSGWQNDDAGTFSSGNDSADWGGGDFSGGDFGGGGGDF